MAPAAESSSWTRGDSGLMRAGRVAQRHVTGREVGVEHAARLDLVPVVVLALDPEDRHRRDAVLGRDALRQPDRRDRLEQREHRPAEQRRLLAGDDRDGVRIAQLRGRRQRLGRRAAAALLRLQNRGHRLALPRMLLRAGDRAAPRGRIGGIAGKELRHAP